MVNKEQEKKLSEQISDFINLLENSSRSYNYFFEKMQETDKATHDFLHKCEEGTIVYKDRAKYWLRLEKIRQERRAHKDCVEELEPISNYANNNKKVINELRNLLSMVRKQEKYHEKRQYFPRVIDFNKLD